MKDFACSNTDNQLALAQTLPDPEISTLALVLDPSRLRKNLRCLAFMMRQWGELHEVRVQVLRFQTGRRCTFEIGLRTATGFHTLIGKVYALDSADIFRVMQQISDAGFGPEAEFSIPQPIAYMAKERLVLQEKVTGRLAEEVFVKGDEGECAQAAERCARWLARFHSMAPKLGPVFNLNDYLMRLAQWSRNLTGSGDPLSGKVAQLLDNLERTASGLEDVETCTCHGDYSPAQVLLAEGRTATCDWDSCCVGDPTRDVARFLTVLELLAQKYRGSIHALKLAGELFVETYTSLRGPVNDSHLRFYKAAQHLKMAQRKIVKVYWRHRIEGMLDESHRALEPISV